MERSCVSSGLTLFGPLRVLEVEEKEKSGFPLTEGRLYAILLERKLLTLSAAQALVEKDAAQDLPEQTAILLEYIHQNFTEEELRERERQNRERLPELDEDV